MLILYDFTPALQLKTPLHLGRSLIRKNDVLVYIPSGTDSDYINAFDVLKKTYIKFNIIGEIKKCRYGDSWQFSVLNDSRFDEVAIKLRKIYYSCGKLCNNNHTTMDAVSYHYIKKRINDKVKYIFVNGAIHDINSNIYCSTDIIDLFMLE